MGTLNLLRFTRIETLRAINPQLLLQLLLPYEDFFQARGVDLKLLTEPEQFEYAELANVFMNPDTDTPDGLSEALYYINEMSTADGMDDLLDETEKRGLQISYNEKSTPEDIAVQVWLSDREIVERKHAEQFLTRPKSFEYYQTKNETTSLIRITEKKLKNIERDLDDWFEERKRGRTSKVFSYPKRGETWFLVRHGEPYKREGGIKDGESTSIFYRPETFDVVVYNEIIGEIRINAGLIGIKKLYRQMFGRHFFNDDDFFPGAEKYTLAPLKDDGQESLVCTDIEGLEWVRLKELHFYWGGQFREVEIRRADDLLAAWANSGREIPANGRIVKAKFQLKFENAKNPRVLSIRPPNIANFTRDGDSVIGELWLAKRGFILNACVSD